MTVCRATILCISSEKSLDVVTRQVLTLDALAEIIELFKRHHVLSANSHGGHHLLFIQSGKCSAGCSAGISRRQGAAPSRDGGTQRALHCRLACTQT